MASAEISIVIPMDGYHYSRAQLQQIANKPDSKYTYDQLLARRGAPWTFDAKVIYTRGLVLYLHINMCIYVIICSWYLLEFD